MDTLTKAEIDIALSARLPHCRVKCAVNPDGNLSVTVLVQGADQFTIANIKRAQYHEEPGFSRLIREILEEMVISRQSSRLSSTG
ncbi:hypothetical protein [Pseudomonas sp. W2I6]|uniref:hypothetical protein n=1 Tax=Pseudomonas sp. W2I6 TaxID=3042289 RepID=UPI00278AF1D7|nr:hypothetical protein [Pseudomonas sp. W2I6]MDQ0668273.1 hypothetical protein [Pseudomonas sp. W2I6]